MVNPGQVSKIILRAGSLPDAWPLRKPLLTSETGVGGTVASWLVCSTPDRAVRVRALARDIVLCSWARHFTVTVPLSTQVYKWVPGANLMLGGNPAMDQLPIQGGVEILSVASCCRSRDKLWPDGPLGLYADFTFTFFWNRPECLTV